MKWEVKNELALRYAQACVDVFNTMMREKDCQALQAAAHFLSSHRRIIAFLQMPIIDTQTKMQAFDSIISAYTLPVWLTSLFSVLLDHNRIVLLAPILYAISRIYRQLNGIELFTISSAASLNEQQKKACETFLTQKIGKKIISQYIQDTSLIAGIRMQSNKALWEHSIKKQLRVIQHHFCPVGNEYES